MAQQTTAPERKYIKDLLPNQFIDTVLTMNNCQLGQTRGGKPFLKCLLSDKSGQTAGRMWNATEELFEKLPTDGFVWVSGQTQPYQGQMQIIIEDIRPTQPNPEELADLLPCTQFDIGEMFAALTQRLGALDHPAIKALAQAYLDDEALMHRFRQAPAAMVLHHAYIGGLLEHTLQLMRLAEVFCPLYPQLNRDLVVMGLFIHDLGKCVELSWTTGFSYSEDGRLVGHIGRGAIMLEAKARAVAEAGTSVAEPVLRVLHHIILSHHGKPEFGALKVPATPEAVAVSHLDDMDAKLHMVIAAADRERFAQRSATESAFTDKIWALETQIYRPDPTTLGQ